jgi:hypothetical protein
MVVGRVVIKDGHGCKEILYGWTDGRMDGWMDGHVLLNKLGRHIF